MARVRCLDKRLMERVAMREFDFSFLFTESSSEKFARERIKEMMRTLGTTMSREINEAQKDIIVQQLQELGWSTPERTRELEEALAAAQKALEDGDKDAAP